MHLLDYLPRHRPRGPTLQGPCPCDKKSKDRFVVWPDQGRSATGRYWCRKCDRSGDAVSYLIEFENLTFVQACRRLGIEVTPLPAERSDRDVLPPVHDRSVNRQVEVVTSLSDEDLGEAINSGGLVSDVATTEAYLRLLTQAFIEQDAALFEASALRLRERLALLLLLLFYVGQRAPTVLRRAMEDHFAEPAEDVFRRIGIGPYADWPNSIPSVVERIEDDEGTRYRIDPFAIERILNKGDLLPPWAEQLLCDT